MNNIKATKRDTSSTVSAKKLRMEGFIPAIIYGGTKENLPISLRKIFIKDIVKSDSFMSSVLNLDIDGNNEKVLPRDMALDPLSNEPIHIDFMRISQGKMIALEIPVKFINNDKSPGLKKGGVLNIVRRKIECKCPAENIPEEIVIDLENKEIGTSIKISMVKLPEKVTPIITDRDFTIATVVSPSVVIEPEKPAEETPEGEGTATQEGTTEVAGTTTAETGDKAKPAAAADGKSKSSEKEESVKKK